MTLLDVRNIKKYFPIKQGIFSGKKAYLKAVDDVSFTLEKGETLGLVGESGSGKTTLGHTILRLTEPSSGHALFNGQNLLSLNRKKMKQVRTQFQIIFQDPYSSLNPRMRVDNIISEPIRTHRKASRTEINDRVAYLMEKVGLHPRQMKKYPHEFSGGQRQRIGIARALALDPLAIICDEAVSALDVSVQAQILNLLVELQEEMNLSYLFISHDLSVVEHISDRVAIMYRGQIVELANHEQIYRNPRHPYTRSLLSAIPNPDPRQHNQRIILKEDGFNPLKPSPGCKFQSRCPECENECTFEVPKLKDAGEGHFVACHFGEAEDSSQ